VCVCHGSVPVCMSVCMWMVFLCLSFSKATFLSSIFSSILTIINHIFTDGSKVWDKLAAAVVHEHNSKSVRLPNNISIFRAELYALDLAIDVVCRSRELDLVIVSDSKSSLEAINNFQIEVDIVQKFIKDYTILSNSGKNILLCWMPSHMGIRGNEKADTAAKAALSPSVIPMKLPASKFFPCVNTLISEEWQKIWDNCTGNKLRCIRHIYAIHLFAVTTE